MAGGGHDGEVVMWIIAWTLFVFFCMSIYAGQYLGTAVVIAVAYWIFKPFFEKDPY